MKENKLLRFGIIGTGHLGKLHTKLSSQIENINLAGVFDINKSNAEAVANEFSTNSYENLDELISNVDAVSIAATTSAHYELAKKCLSKGVHVLIEKPITATIQEAEEIVSLAKEKNLILQVGHIERFNPALLSLEKYNLNPRFIQTDRLAQFNPRGTDVAVVLDLMIHDIDIILSLVGSDVISVEASGVAVVTNTLDIANARIQFENGAVANVTASRISQKKMRKMRMFQRDAYISLDFDSGVSEVFRLTDPGETFQIPSLTFGQIGVGEKKRSIVYEQPEVKEVNALKYEIELFADAVINNKKPVVSGEDGLRALKVAELIIEKINQSQII